MRRLLSPIKRRAEPSRADTPQAADPWEEAADSGGI